MGIVGDMKKDAGNLFQYFTNRSASSLKTACPLQYSVDVSFCQFMGWVKEEIRWAQPHFTWRQLGDVCVQVRRGWACFSSLKRGLVSSIAYSEIKAVLNSSVNKWRAINNCFIRSVSTVDWWGEYRIWGHGWRSWRLAKENMEQLEKCCHSKPRAVGGVYWLVPPHAQNRMWVAENIYKKLKQWLVNIVISQYSD